MNNWKFLLLLIVMAIGSLYLNFCDDNGLLGNLPPPTPQSPPIHWFESISGHPRLMADEETLIEARSRISDPNYTTFYNRLQGVCSRSYQTVDPEKFDGPNGYSNGNIAKACATLYWLENDPSYLDKTKEILLNTFNGFNPDLLDANSELVHGGSSIIGQCEAYDLLLGADVLTSTEQETITAKLSQQVSDYYQFFVVQYPVHLRNHCDSLNLISAAVIGIGALLFPEHPDAFDWMTYSIANFDFFFNFLSNDEGGWGEGYYQVYYYAMHYIPFLLAYSYNSGGENTVIESACSHVPIVDICTDTGAYTIVKDFWNLRKLQKHWDMVVYLRLPDGSRPPLEDSFFHGWWGGIIGSMTNNPVQIWDYQTVYNSNFQELSSHNFDLTPETIVHYDASITPQEPEGGPSYYFPQSGNAVMRSGWAEDDLYLLFIAENGLMRNWSHEQVDDLSFQIYAHGEYLAIDSGYINWRERSDVAFAENHNVILIDGKGPPNPVLIPPPVYYETFNAYMSEWESNNNFDFVSGYGEYENTEVHRSIIFPHKEYFIVEDKMLADANHTYTWLLHGNGGGDTDGTFALTADGGIWTRPSGVQLQVWMESSSGGTITFSEQTNIHGNVYDQRDQHSVLSAEISGQSLTLLSVVIPLDSGDSATITPLGGLPANTVGWKIQMAGRSYSDFVISRPEAAAGSTFNLASAGFKDGITFDGTLLIVSVENAVPTNALFFYAVDDDDFAY